MTVAVVIPWRAGCLDRERGFAFVLKHLAEIGHRVVVGEIDEQQPWCKAEAVRRALAENDASKLVIHDADVVVDHAAVRECVDALDVLPWAIPHRQVVRLSDVATNDLYETGEFPIHVHHRGSYVGQAAGGVLVIRRNVYERIPFDPRFVGWGGEDVALDLALTMLVGAPLRLPSRLWHLYHPGGGMPRPKLPPDAAVLTKRYRDAVASHDPRRMLALIEEAKTCSTSPLT